FIHQQSMREASSVLRAFLPLSSSPPFRTSAPLRLRVKAVLLRPPNKEQKTKNKEQLLKRESWRGDIPGCRSCPRDRACHDTPRAPSCARPPSRRRGRCESPPRRGPHACHR